jgi:hypothetical protein
LGLYEWKHLARQQTAKARQNLKTDRILIQVLYQDQISLALIMNQQGTIKRYHLFLKESWSQLNGTK